MIGRLNHVAIAVPDLEAASRLYRDTLGADVTGADAAARARRHRRLRRTAQHQDRTAGAAGRGLADRQSSWRRPRTAASTTSATRSTTSSAPATALLARRARARLRRAADRRPRQARAVPASEGLLRHARRARAGLSADDPDLAQASPRRSSLTLGTVLDRALAVALAKPCRVRLRARPARWRSTS